jgi:hypothetical protein
LPDSNAFAVDADESAAWATMWLFKFSDYFHVAFSNGCAVADT